MDGLEKIAQKLKMGCTCCVEATGSQSLKRKAGDCRTKPKSKAKTTAKARVVRKGKPTVVFLI